MVVVFAPPPKLTPPLADTLKGLVTPKNEPLPKKLSVPPVFPVAKSPPLPVTVPPFETLYVILLPIAKFPDVNTKVDPVEPEVVSITVAEEAISKVPVWVIGRPVPVA